MVVVVGGRRPGTDDPSMLLSLTPPEEMIHMKWQ